MRRVLMIEGYIPEYRVSLFEKLHGALENRGVSLRVAYGSQSRADAHGYSRDRYDLSFGRRLTNRWFLGGRLIFQPVLSEIINADLVIVEQANKYLANYLLLLLSRLGLKKVAFWGHGWNRQRRSERTLSERFKAALVRYPDWWFAYTQGTARYLRSKGVRADAITVVQNSLDVKGFQELASRIGAEEIDRTRSNLGIGLTSDVALFCGRLYRDRNLPLLLSAASIVRSCLPDFHLIVIGDGPERRLVEDFAGRQSWVHWVGERTGRQKAAYFRLAAVALNPGAVGVGILEAFGCGLPFVTTDIPAHGPEIEYLTDGENGLVSRPRPSDYAAAMIRALTDSSLRARLRARALSTAGVYTLEAMVENFVDGILHCLEE